MTTIRVFAPATVANVACGFDVLGFALETPGDEIEVILSPEPGVRIIAISGDRGVLPTDPTKNTASVAALELLRHLNLEGKVGIEISIHKKMPLKSGLGSSAASAAGSVFAVNELLGKPLTNNELIAFAMKGEQVACGAAHADNVAPALLGGITLIRSYKPLDVIEVSCPLELFCTILHPHIEISTEDARNLLNKEISLEQYVIQTGNIAGLMVGLMEGNERLISRSLKDVIVEPVRSQLIPGFTAIKAAAMITEALGCSISGSGPSIFALSTSLEQATTIGQAMQAASTRPADLFISKVNKTGPRVLHDTLL